VSNDSKNPSIFSSLRSLWWPLIIGLGLFVLFYLGVKQGTIANSLVFRYFAGHPVSLVVTGMFFVGVSGLAMKGLEVLLQNLATDRVHLDEPPADGQTVEDCDSLLESLTIKSKLFRDSYLWRRLHDAIEFVQRKQSPAGLDDELKYLADQDVARQQESYSLVRILIWATPMLGFLGTVIGITLALEDFGKQDFSGENLNGAMDVLLSGLYIAFDTTALALSLSVVMMFLQFVIDRFETQLLESVDARVSRELVGRFDEIGGGSDPHVRSIELMGRSVIRSSEQLVERQSELWQATIESAHQHWSSLTDTSTSQMTTVLADALDSSLQHHAARMQQIEEHAAEQLHQRWTQLHATLAENARAMYEQQKQMLQQGEIMKQVVDSTGDVIKLEALLNENLRSLSGAKNFEDTVMSLSAAIHLLNTRLGQSDSSKRVELGDGKSQERAA